MIEYGRSIPLASGGSFRGLTSSFHHVIPPRAAAEWEARQRTSGGFQAKNEVAPAGRDHHFKGYATRFNKVHMGKNGYEIICPGAFTPNLAKGETVRFLRDHDEAKCLAWSNGGGLQLQADGIGIAFSLSLPGETGAALKADVRNGVRTEMSVGIQVLEEDERKIEGLPIRMILNARLREISAVKNGAVPGTFIEVSSSSEAPDAGSEAQAEAGAAYAKLIKAHGALLESFGR